MQSRHPWALSGSTGTVAEHMGWVNGAAEAEGTATAKSQEEVGTSSLPKPHFAWNPERGEARGGQTDLIHAGPSLLIRPPVKSGGQPLGAPSGHSAVSSAMPEYTFSMVAQKRHMEAGDHQSVHPSSPLLACKALGMGLVYSLSCHKCLWRPISARYCGGCQANSADP